MSREIFGLLLLVIQGVINFPIIYTILKKKRAKGISLTGETIWIAGGLGWIFYGIATNSITLIISGSLAALGCSIVSFLVIHYEKSKKRNSLLIGAATFLVIFLAWQIGDIVGLSIALSTFGIVQFIPQFVTTVNLLIKKEPARGVSQLGATARVFYTGGWALYAGAWLIWGISFGEIDWPLVVWGLAGVITFGLQAFHVRSLGNTTQTIKVVKT